MKYIKNFEELFNYNRLNDIETFTVYRGSVHEEPYTNNKIFFSVSKDFAKDYGKYIYKAEIKPMKIFDSFNPEHWKLLFQWNKDGVYDSYNDKTYYSFDEMIENNAAWDSDTWEIIEYHINRIESEGYDCVLITEGGQVNFVIFDKNIIVKSELISNTNENKSDTISDKLENSNYKDKVKDFLEKCKEEVGEYKEAGQILKRYASGEKPSKEEMKKVYDQLIDTLKIGGGGTLFMLPFGSILLIALIKIGTKFGINFLPSSWNKNDSKN